MPQATIKLQPAPAAAAVRKPTEAAAVSATPLSTAPKVSEKSGAKVEKTNDDDEVDDENETESSASELPMALVIAVAALAFVAFGIQLWTYLS